MLTAASGGQGVEVEAVELGRVAGEHGADLGGVDVVEQPGGATHGVRVGALVVGVVAAPHEPVDADDVAGGDVGRAGKLAPDPAVLVEVLGGRRAAARVLAVAQLAESPGRTDAMTASSMLEQLGDPARRPAR